MKVVIVGFKVSEENSIYYRKFEMKDGDNGETFKSGIQQLGMALFSAASKDADFVSVRFIRDGKVS